MDFMVMDWNRRYHCEHNGFRIIDIYGNKHGCNVYVYIHVCMCVCACRYFLLCPRRGNESNDITIVIFALCAQILVSKYNSPLKEIRILKEMANSMAGKENM